MRRHHAQGVTLIELMAVVAIVGILATMAAGTLVSVMRRAQLNALATGCVTAITHARAKAISTNGRCSFRLYSQYIIAFVDTNRDGELNANEEVVYRYPTDPTASIDASVTSTSDLDDMWGRPMAIFDHRGFLVFDSSGVAIKQNLIVFTDNVLKESRSVTISATGGTTITVGP